MKHYSVFDVADKATYTVTYSVRENEEGCTCTRTANPCAHYEGTVLARSHYSFMLPVAYWVESANRAPYMVPVTFEYQDGRRAS